jgi:bifunctional non-homologous end joining protein LigD
MVACIEDGRATLYSRNGKIISHRYVEVARALERVKSDAVLDGELVALDQHGVSNFQLLQNALRHEANQQYCVFDMMFCNGEDLAPFRSWSIRSGCGACCRVIRCCRSAEIASNTAQNSLRRPGSRALRVSWPSGRRARTSQASGPRIGSKSRQPNGRRWSSQVSQLRKGPASILERWSWRCVKGMAGGTSVMSVLGFSHAALERLHAKLLPLLTTKSPFAGRVKDETVTT